MLSSPVTSAIQPSDARDNIVQAVSGPETDYFCSSQLPVPSRHNNGPPESPLLSRTFEARGCSRSLTGDADDFTAEVVVAVLLKSRGLADFVATQAPCTKTESYDDGDDDDDDDDGGGGDDDADDDAAAAAAAAADDDDDDYDDDDYYNHGIHSAADDYNDNEHHKDSGDGKAHRAVVSQYRDVVRRSL
ncbi:hypothetical protein DPMN_003695 [Dreissena polymorpha]|uniref:Uncharacterized protein n=1 Tax=Dreissena polymorpha TaxID=45954 RepID=A0A9D4MQ66_DREPO|nr:hypothetical protein DPMN_003695 [Dreissena polymorpha]